MSDQLPGSGPRPLPSYPGESGLAAQLRNVVTMLVDDPDAVEVVEEERGDTVLLKVQVAPDEIGRVIGRQGRTVRALRTLLEARSERDDVDYELQIVEP